MNQTFTTSRLILEPITTNAANFTLELVNTEGWLHFIGDRKVANLEDAKAHINKMIANSSCWLVQLQETHTPIGICSYHKKEYLDFYDIGFAFLPKYQGNGYAFEAVQSMLLVMAKSEKHPIILAETLKENIKSIALLEKLGLQFHKEMLVDNEMIQVYQCQSKTIIELEKFEKSLKIKDKPKDPLQGKTLEKIITELHELLGWENMAIKIPIHCFESNPSIKSSLKFLRKTPWARKRVEELWLAKIGWQE